MNQSFLPITREEMNALGWDRPDFVLVTGDAYVDHPSFGTAIIARVLEGRGFRVAILPQPNWKNADDFKRFGRPRLAFLVNSGNIDSMVNHYTAQKKPRSSDAYTPGGQAGKRPDRAVIVYANRVREAYRRMPLIIGGIEASLRRFAHYDYWDDKVRRSILTDACADILIYGMGERAVVEIAAALDAGVPVGDIVDVAGTAVVRRDVSGEEDCEVLPDAETVSRDKAAYGQAFLVQQRQACDPKSKPLVQRQGRDDVWVNPPAMPLSGREMDAVYALPFIREPHPFYTQPVPAIEEVRFSLTSCRGCFGSCSFCALTYHQGRVVTSRSHDSILREAESMQHMPEFKGYIHDVGGPTANFWQAACARQRKGAACADKRCLHPKKCDSLEVSHEDFRRLLRELRALPKVKKVFIRSGLRYDYILYDKSSEFLKDLVQHHVSGQLKIAPEHIDDGVLALMGKPESALYERFLQKFQALNQKMGKDQYVVPYFMSSHPGSDLNAAIELSCYMKEKGIRPEQVQDFYPTPGTLSTTMFFTGLDPRNGRPVYIPGSPREKRLQRALLQYFRPQNAALVREALRAAGRDDLIGRGTKALVCGESEERRKTAKRVCVEDRPPKSGRFEKRSSKKQTKKPKHRQKSIKKT